MEDSQFPQTRSSAPWVDIDLGALCANFDFIRASAPKAEIAAVVKCNGYGLGADEIAKTLVERENCRTFFVAHAKEGADLRTALAPVLPDATIYIFNGPAPDTMTLYESASLTPVLNSYGQAKLWAQNRPDAAAALNIETGMNRLGAPVADLDAIASLDGLNLEMVMSHLACSSEPAHPQNALQRDRFIEAAAHFPDARKSLAASGGALMDESYHFDLVRLGIALYGGNPFDKEEPRLKPVAALRAPIIQLRETAPGEAVGYSATFKTERPSLTATVALGYGDGFPRGGSGRASAIINGTKAPIAGRVSMDLITLDVTDLPKAPPIGDVAEFYGPNLSIHDVALACGTISYELLTGLGGRVDRRYL